jgi:hypothetical protein
MFESQTNYLELTSQPGMTIPINKKAHLIDAYFVIHLHSQLSACVMSPWPLYTARPG